MFSPREASQTSYWYVMTQTIHPMLLIEMSLLLTSTSSPARSINFIGLTFVATRTGVSFEEVVGTV